MLRKVISPLMTNTRALFRPSLMPFSTQPQTSKLRSLLDEELDYEQNNKDQQYLSLERKLNGEKWSTKYSGIQVELSKNAQPYELKVIFNAKTPMTAENDGQQEEEEMNQDQFEVHLFMKKQNSSKWMVVDFLKADSQSQISNLYFTTDYEEEKKSKASMKIGSSSGYSGPDFDQLPQGLEDGILELLETLGVNETFMADISSFALSYEHKFYVEWLKDFRAIV